MGQAGGVCLSCISIFVRTFLESEDIFGELTLGVKCGMYLCWLNVKIKMELWGPNGLKHTKRNSV